MEVRVAAQISGGGAGQADSEARAVKVQVGPAADREARAVEAQVELTAADCS